MRSVLVTGDFDIPQGTFPPDIKLIHVRSPINEHPIREVLPLVQGYIVGGPEYVSSGLLSLATELKHIVVMGTGTASFVDIEAARQRGVRVTNTPGLNVKAVVEFTLAMMTVCAAGVFESIECVKEGIRWPQTVRPSLRNQRVGIIGMGNIGHEVAIALSAKGCRQLQYWSRERKHDVERLLGLTYSAVEEIVRTVDYLFVHLAGCDDTYGLIDNDMLSNSKPGLSIFNLSSPRIICADALRGHLLSKPNAFCFIDGYYNEWARNTGAQGDIYHLLTLPVKNLVVTSHLAAQQEDALRAILLSAVAAITTRNNFGS